MSKQEAVQVAQSYGQEASFLANVISMQHRNPARKLKGLAELLKSGHSCRTGQFSTDVLVIDGRKYGWEVLESPSVVDQWANHAERE